MNNLPAAMPLMENAYKYDQLNRLLEHKAWTSASATPGPMGTTQAYSVLTQDANVGKSAYYNAFSYDADGNILTQKRNGTAALWQMDQLTYNYQSGTNKLTSVGDGVIGTQSLNYDDDLESQAGNNYTYDQIGNLVSDASEGIASIEWNVYGKIKSITRVNGFSKTTPAGTVYPPDLEFGYDAMGQRVLKIVKTRDANGVKPQVDWKYTYYVRDAAGNVLTTYNRTITVDQTNAAYRIDKYKVDEWTMYGASRLGVQEPSGEGVTAAELKFEPEQNNTITVISRTATAVPTTSLLRKAGEKIYELANHLGNVLVTVTDRLLPVQNVSAPTQTLYYSADVKSATDYSAFGAPLAGRTNNAPGYRYSMNGQEKDEELGSGVTSADYWQYDAKTARRWNIDPIVKPWESGYATFYNSPVSMSDRAGLDGTPEALAPPTPEQMSNMGYATTSMSQLNSGEELDLNSPQVSVTETTSSNDQNNGLRRFEFLISITLYEVDFAAKYTSTQNSKDQMVINGEQLEALPATLEFMQSNSPAMSANLGYGTGYSTTNYARGSTWAYRSPIATITISVRAFSIGGGELMFYEGANQDLHSTVDGPLNGYSAAIVSGASQTTIVPNIAEIHLVIGMTGDPDKLSFSGFEVGGEYNGIGAAIAFSYGGTGVGTSNKGYFDYTFTITSLYTSTDTPLLNINVDKAICRQSLTQLEIDENPQQFSTRSNQRYIPQNQIRLTTPQVIKTTPY